MLCAALGVVAALLGRRLLITAGLARSLFAAPLVYLTVAVSVTPPELTVYVKLSVP